MTDNDPAVAETEAREDVTRSADNCPFYPACFVVGDCAIDDWKRDNCGLPEPEKTIARKQFWERLFAPLAITRQAHREREDG